MDKEMIFRAPQVSEVVAVTKGYIDAAVIGMVLSYECYKRWRHLGTDCVIFLASCPFSDEINQELILEIKNSKEAREKIYFHRQ